MTTTAPTADEPTSPEPPAPARRKVPRWRRTPRDGADRPELHPRAAVGRRGLGAQPNPQHRRLRRRPSRPRAQRGDRERHLDAGHEQLFDNVDVETLAKDVLPPTGLVPRRPAHDRAAGVHQAADAALLRIRAVPGIWDEANRSAHEQVVKALTGGGPDQDRERARRARPLGLLVNVRSELSARGIGIFDDLPIGNARAAIRALRRRRSEERAGRRAPARQAGDRPPDPRDRVRRGRYLARGRPAQGAHALGHRRRDRVARTRVRLAARA